MSNIQKIKSLLLLLCFIVSAFIYYSTANDTIESKEIKNSIAKTKKDQKDKVSESQEKASVTTVYYE